MDGNTSIEQVPTCKQFWKNHTLTLEGHKKKTESAQKFYYSISLCYYISASMHVPYFK